jgi:hypothetical protein
MSGTMLIAVKIQSPVKPHYTRSTVYVTLERAAELVVEGKATLEDLIPVEISTEPPCKGCRLGFEREEYEGKYWHVWEGRAYPCTEIL